MDVFFNVFQDVAGAQLMLAGKQVLPNVAVDEPPNPVGDDGDHEQPREGQVPAARQREVISRWYGEPAGEGGVHRLMARPAQAPRSPVV